MRERVHEWGYFRDLIGLPEHLDRDVAMSRNVTIETLELLRNRADMAQLIVHMEARNVVEIGVKEGGNFNNLLRPCVLYAVAIDVWQETG